MTARHSFPRALCWICVGSTALALTACGNRVPAEELAGDRVVIQDFERNDVELDPYPPATGKLEFYSEELAKNFPDDKERPPIPKWIERSHYHDEPIKKARSQTDLT